MNNESVKLVPHKLQYFPVMMFSVVVGLSGLSLVYGEAHKILGLSNIFYEILFYLTIFIFFAAIV